MLKAADGREFTFVVRGECHRYRDSSSSDEQLMMGQIDIELQRVDYGRAVENPIMFPLHPREERCEIENWIKEQFVPGNAFWCKTQGDLLADFRKNHTPLPIPNLTPEDMLALQLAAQQGQYEDMLATLRAVRQGK
jgi:hypothetical protein